MKLVDFESSRKELWRWGRNDGGEETITVLFL